MSKIFGSVSNTLYFYIMEVDEMLKNNKLKAKSFVEAILPIIQQYLLTKEKLNQLNEKGIKVKEPFDSLNAILNFCEQTIINEMREIKL